MQTKTANVANPKTCWRPTGHLGDEDGGGHEVDHADGVLDGAFAQHEHPVRDAQPQVGPHPHGFRPKGRLRGIGVPMIFVIKITRNCNNNNNN